MSEHESSSCASCGYPSHAGHQASCSGSIKKSKAVGVTGKLRALMLGGLLAVGAMAKNAPEPNAPEPGVNTPVHHRDTGPTVSQKQIVSDEIISGILAQSTDGEFGDESAGIEYPDYSLDFRTIPIGKMVLRTFPDATRVDPNNPFDINVDKSLLETLKKDPELMKDFMETTQDIVFEKDENTLRVYLPDTEGFDLTLTMANNDGRFNIYTGEDRLGEEGVIASTQNPDGFARESTQAMLRHYIQEKLLRYLQGE